MDVPYPDFALATEQGLNPTVLRNIQIAVWLHRQKKTMKTDCPDMGAAKHAELTEPLFHLPESGGFCLSGSPPQSMMEARLRAVYWHTKARVYKPAIHAALHQPASEAGPKVIRYAIRGVEAYMESLEAISSLSVPIVMPNILSLLERYTLDPHTPSTMSWHLLDIGN